MGKWAETEEAYFGRTDSKEDKETMKNRVLPILFNTEMVQAILDGRKTVTRRVLKHPFEVHPNGFITKPRGNERLCPYEPPYQPDDILYVRETWSFLPCIECMDEGPTCNVAPVVYDDGDSESEGCFVYKASHPRPERVSWTPSIHMPKKAARIWLKVTDVRVERLQDITEQQAEAEGLYESWSPAPKAAQALTARQAFMWLWDTTVKRDEDKWLFNPYVDVVSFERCEKPAELRIIEGK